MYSVDWEIECPWNIPRYNYRTMHLDKEFTQTEHVSRTVICAGWAIQSACRIGLACFTFKSLIYLRPISMDVAIEWTRPLGGWLTKSFAG